MIVQNHARTIATLSDRDVRDPGGAPDASKPKSRAMGSVLEKFPVQGICDVRFEGVREAFEANFERGADVGASVAITLDGETVVDLWGGAKDAAASQAWTSDTIVAVASTTKTATALSALLLADRGELDVDAPVARYWPEFAQAGKDGVLVRHCLGHTAGLPGWEPRLATMDDLYDWEKCTSLLAAQAPWWEPGTASGYHAVTQGYLVGEVIRRITGRTPGTFFREEIAEPLGAEFHIGVQPRFDALIGESIPPDVPEAPAETAPGSITMRIHNNPPLPRERWGETAWLRAEIPAGNGFANARGVARISTMLACEGLSNGKRLMSPEGAARVFYQQSDGPDLGFLAPVRWGLGYALALFGMNFHGRKVCFWGGSGGALIVVDIPARMTLAYTMNKLEGSPFGDPRNTAILRAAYQALGVG
jgi:CubicO group peptidase (beta-lactamase class C family)